MFIHLSRTQTSLFDVRAKEGGKETTGFACRLYPSHGPLRFITSHTRFALASAMRKTKRLRRRLLIYRVRQDEKNIPKIFHWRWSKLQVTVSLFCRYNIIASSFVYFGSSIASVKPWDHLNKNLPTMGLRSFVEAIKTLQKIKRNAVPFKFTGVE